MIEKEWMIKIKKATNGYVVEELQSISEEQNLYRVVKQVFEEKKMDRQGELETMVELLYFVMDFFGISRNKREKNIEIKIKDNDEK